MPRYDPFTPDMLGIYDDRAVLYEVQCASCGRLFRVAESQQLLARLVSGDDDLGYWFRQVAPYYGDAPRHDHPYGGRCAGETMTSDTVRVIEFWRKDKLDWERVPELEGTPWTAYEDSKPEAIDD